MDDAPREREDNLDAFFKAADTNRPGAMRLAARNVTTRQDDQEEDEFSEPPPQYDDLPAVGTGAYTRTATRSIPREDAFPVPEESGENTRVMKQLARVVVDTDDPPFPVPPGNMEYDDVQFIDGDDEPDTPPGDLPKDLEGKFIAVDSGSSDSDQPFVLIPANIHHFVPWWGWLTIVCGLCVLVAGVVLMPMLSLDRLVSRLGDGNEANVQRAMRQIVVKADERTVKKLYGMATSNKTGLNARLRAVDTMSLIERVPEVDRALLRLELAVDTDSKVREAAIAARKQREAYKTRGLRR